MSAGNLLLSSRAESAGTISVRQQLLQSFRDPEYRHEFVNERLRASVALQIRGLRQARGMTQKELGDAIGMAQTWVSKLENPDYGKTTVATLLRLADAFDTDLEIKFGPFSRALDSLRIQGREYFTVPSFDEEFSLEVLAPEDLRRVKAIEDRLRPRETQYSQEASDWVSPSKKPACMADQGQYGSHQGPIARTIWLFDIQELNPKGATFIRKSTRGSGCDMPLRPVQ
jgi:transcriptional regulator with XRE-family HTH domain